MKIAVIILSIACFVLVCCTAVLANKAVKRKRHIRHLMGELKSVEDEINAYAGLNAKCRELEKEVDKLCHETKSDLTKINNLKGTNKYLVDELNFDKSTMETIADSMKNVGVKSSALNTVRDAIREYNEHKEHPQR